MTCRCAQEPLPPAAASAVVGSDTGAWAAATNPAA